MSETVWIEQVDTALKSFISGGISIDNSPARVVVRKPDEDFKREYYPLISIYNLFNRHDTTRRFFGSVPKSKDLVNNTVTMEQACIPYNLFYQIDFWSMKQSQMNSMTLQWVLLTNGAKDFNLPVIDTGGTTRSSYCLCKDDFKKSDLITGAERIFHSFITYRIYVEVDENVQKIESLATKLAISTKEVK